MNKIKRTCLLHIGAPKTGSTALEKFLAYNRNVLNRLNWHYPDVCLRGFGHHDLAFLISGGYPDWATRQERPLDELLTELAKEVAEREQIILSSENFFLFSDPKKVANMLRNVDFPPETVKVIVYVRRQDEVHISWYNQAVKAQGYTGLITECIAETRDLWNYADRLESWAEVFGRENIIVRPYQTEDLVDGDICLDFLRLAGLVAEDFEWPEDTINTRINRDILEFQRLINRLPMSVQEKRRFHKQLIELTAATASMNLFDDTSLLTVDQQHEILSLYTDSNACVARTYLGRANLFNENISDEISTGESEKGLTIEKLTYILGWILAKQN